MRKLLIIVLITLCGGTSFAQSYQVLYTALTSISQFKSIKINGDPKKHMYFQPNGVSGAPCSVMDSMNLNTYRLLSNGTIYKPFNGMLNRFVCNDINDGCSPVAMRYFDVSSTDTNFIVGIRVITGNPYYVNCSSNEYTKFTSYNGGANITSSPVLSVPNGLDIAPQHDTIVMYATNGSWPYSLFRSTDRGATFDFVPILYRYLSGLIKFSTRSDRFVFVGTLPPSGTLYRSTNFGSSFAELTGVSAFTDMVFDNVSYVYGINNSGVFRSANNGLHWTQVFTTLCNSIEIDPDNDSTIYVGTDNGVYRSTNRGTTFYQQGYNFPGSNKVIGLSKDEGSGDTIIVCTQNGIYKVWDLETGITQVTNTTPSDFKLDQNYPNPFNPSTNISFDIPERAYVTLNIYDGMGRLVREIANSTLITGKYTYTWDAADRSSGVYYARFTARGESGSTYSDSKKLLLIK